MARSNLFDLESHELRRQLITIFRTHLPGNFRVREDLRHAIGFLMFASTTWAAWDHKSERVEIERLKVALLDAQKAWRRIDDSIQFGMYQEASARAVNVPDGPDSPVTALLMLERIFDQLEPSIEAGIEKIPKGKGPGRTNWLAVQAVDASRTVWHWRTSKPAPRSVNPASPFFDYLLDVLGLFGIQADPVSAMNAWRREFIENPKKST